MLDPPGQVELPEPPALDWGIERLDQVVGLEPLPDLLWGLEVEEHYPRVLDLEAVLSKVNQLVYGGVYPKTWCTKMEKAVKMKGNIKGKREEGDTVREELVLEVLKEFQGSEGRAEGVD